MGDFFQNSQRCPIDDFHKYKIPMGLYNGENPVVAQL